MPTNDERREIAKILRDICNGKQNVPTTMVLDSLNLWEPAFSNLFLTSESVKDLADLIEPEPERTCYCEMCGAKLEDNIGATSAKS